jgi:hypothetical protein
MFPGFNNKCCDSFKTVAPTVADVKNKNQLRLLSLEVANEESQSDNFLVVVVHRAFWV